MISFLLSELSEQRSFPSCCPVLSSGPTAGSVISIDRFYQAVDSASVALFYGGFMMGSVSMEWRT